MIKKPTLTSFLFVTFFLLSFTQSKEYLLKFKNAQELSDFLKYSGNRIPLVSAHRGGPTFGFPENCIETFQNTITYHPAIIETDIALSKDSALVMMHDNKLDRTTIGTGNVGDFTLSELKQLKLEDNAGKATTFSIPTLDEVLIWGKDKVIYTLDVKRGVPYAKVIEAVRKNKAEAYSVIITYNVTQAAEVAKLAPDLMVSVSLRGKEDFDRLVQAGVNPARMVAFVGTAEPIDKSVYEFLHSKGIQCILGTMGNLDNSAKANGEEKYQQFIANGADILSSDRNQEAGLQLWKMAQEKQLKSKHLIIK